MKWGYIYTVYDPLDLESGRDIDGGSNFGARNRCFSVTEVAYIELYECIVISYQLVFIPRMCVCIDALFSE